MNIIDEFKIEEFQNFQQCLRINPINIQITDQRFKINCCFMRTDINIDSLQIIFCLVFNTKKCKCYIYYGRWIERR